MAKYATGPCDPELVHPTIDTTGRHSTDQKLRAFGYEIFGRPKNAEPLWTKNGKVLKQSAALAAIKTEIKRLETKTTF